MNKNLTGQKRMFYASHLRFASDIHLKMAEMQAKSGKENLANESRKTALSRRMAARNLDGFKGDLSRSLDYAESAVKRNLA